MHNTSPEQRQITCEGAQPNSALRVGRNGMRSRNLRPGEFLAHLEIADAD